MPLVDDFGIDAIIRKHDNTFIEVQIKARSETAILGDAALFAAIVHPEVRPNYYFVFYAERMKSMWIMSSEEFDKEAVRNKTGKNVGKRSIWFNGKKKARRRESYLSIPIQNSTGIRQQISPASGKSRSW